MRMETYKQTQRRVLQGILRGIANMTEQENIQNFIGNAAHFGVEVTTEQARAEIKDLYAYIAGVAQSEINYKKEGEL
jgi:hypothetical protein